MRLAWIWLEFCRSRPGLRTQDVNAYVGRKPSRLDPRVPAEGPSEDRVERREEGQAQHVEGRRDHQETLPQDEGPARGHHEVEGEQHDTVAPHAAFSE